MERNRRPLRARLIDLGDRALCATGLRHNRLEPQAVKAAAIHSVGLEDFGEPDFEEGLALFCRSAEEEGRIDYVGRQVLRSLLKRALANRLLLVHHLSQDPEPVQLVSPVIVLGLPRTGTSYLQWLLAQDPVAYGPPTWQVLRPLPRPSGPDRRREVTAKALEGMRVLSPDLERKHHQDVDQPEECYHLLDPSFRAPGLSMLCHCRSYFDWALAGDVRPAYRMYRQFLEVIQAGVPGRRLTLKAPLHTPYMVEILDEIPSVRFVQTHRDPVAATGSLASLVYSMLAMTSCRITPAQCGRVALELMQGVGERIVAQREGAELPVVDVAYRELVSEPVGVVRRVHEEHGLGWTPEIEARVRAGVADRPQHGQGRHHYRLEDFDLDRAEILEAVAPYLERFGGLVELS